MTKEIGGHPSPIVERYDDMRGSSVAVTTTLAQLSAVSEPCFSVLLVADPANGQNVLVGNGLDAAFFPLTPGSGLSIRIDNVSKIWVQAAAGNQTVHYLRLM